MGVVIVIVIVIDIVIEIEIVIVIVPVMVIVPPSAGRQGEGEKKIIFFFPGTGVFCSSSGPAKIFSKNFSPGAIKSTLPALYSQNSKHPPNSESQFFCVFPPPRGAGTPGKILNPGTQKGIGKIQEERYLSMKKSYIAAALALTSSMVVGAAAVSQSQNVTATFRPDITLKVNGTAYTVRDTNGAAVSPLIYNGTTYLPLASLGRMLDVEVSWDAATNTVVINDADTASAAIGEAKAKDLALSHAGLTAGQVTFLQVKLDWEDGRQVYEVEFYSGSKEYDYEIDTATGAIVSYDYDIENYTIPSSGSSAGLIGEARAKDLALSHAGLSSSQVTFAWTKLDWEDGRQVYEVEFYSGSKEYDYDIDAVSGQILSYDYDMENYTAPSSSNGSYISREKAQQLAQAKAPGATLVELEFDYDDGRAVYEGELREGRMEYEFEIDASTGNFIKWEQDWDD